MSLPPTRGSRLDKAFQRTKVQAWPLGEADYQHIDYIRDTLLHYNYTSMHRDYQNVQGVSSSAAIISQHINEGVSIINYCNHGSPTSWGVFSYTNSQLTP